MRNAQTGTITGKLASAPDEHRANNARGDGAAASLAAYSQKKSDMVALSTHVHALGQKSSVYSTIQMGTSAGFIDGSAPTANDDYSSLPLVPENECLQRCASVPAP